MTCFYHPAFMLLWHHTVSFFPPQWNETLWRQIGKQTETGGKPASKEAAKMNELFKIPLGLAGNTCIAVYVSAACDSILNPALQALQSSHNTPVQTLQATIVSQLRVWKPLCWKMNYRAHRVRPTLSNEASSSPQEVLVLMASFTVLMCLYGTSSVSFFISRPIPDAV